MVTVKGIDTRMPTPTSTQNASCPSASQLIGSWMIPTIARLALTMPYWPLKDQVQTMAVMVSDTAQGSITIVRATPRP
ncbi:hypothetical protein D3C72_1665020 [compost metagenome]